MGRKYLELDSTYRNRNIYPNPSSFVSGVTISSAPVNGITAVDPVLDAFPYYPPIGSPLPVFAGGTAAIPVLDANASTINNYYIGSILEDVTIGETRTITAYNGGTKAATVDTPFSGAWAVGDSFQIRNGIPVNSGALTAVTSSSVNLALTASTINGYYIGYYLYITSGPAAGTIKKIISYTGATRTAGIGPTFTILPLVGDSYEILPFSYDNYNPINFRGNNISLSQPMLYEIRLLNLNIPNLTLTSGNGGLPAFLSYLYVELTNNDSGNGHNVLYSNNPNSYRAMFRVPMDDVSDPIVSRFLKLDGNDTIQRVKFNLDKPIRFSVYLPNGELFLTGTDNFSPLPPNSDMQISALFEFKRGDDEW